MTPKIDNTSTSFHCNLMCKASLGKRKVQSLGDCKPAEISITLCPSFAGLFANCWIRNKDNVFGVKLSHDELIVLHDQLAKAIEETKKYTSNQG